LGAGAAPLKVIDLPPEVTNRLKLTDVFGPLNAGLSFTNPLKLASSTRCP
jgi:hypothetical protein